MRVSRFTFLLVAAVAVAPVASAQAPLDTPPDSTLAMADSSLAVPDTLVATASLRGLLKQAEQERESLRANALLRNAIDASMQPTEHVFGSGMRLTLPPGWDGPTAALESDPSYALYTFQNETASHPLRGAVVRIEHVTGLNELMRERWRRGLTTYGYHGTEAIGPLTAPRPGFVVEVAGPGQAGVVVFDQRDTGMWAVQVLAPVDVWNGHRAEVLGLLAALTLP